MDVDTTDFSAEFEIPESFAKFAHTRFQPMIRKDVHYTTPMHYPKCSSTRERNHYMNGDNDSLTMKTVKQSRYFVCFSTAN